MSKEISTKDEGPKPKLFESEDEESVPQLNEDIFGRILKFVVEKKQRKIRKIVLREECGRIDSDVLIDEGKYGKQYEPVRYKNAFGVHNVKLGCWIFFIIDAKSVSTQC